MSILLNAIMQHLKTAQAECVQLSESMNELQANLSQISFEDATDTQIENAENICTSLKLQIEKIQRALRIDWQNLLALKRQYQKNINSAKLPDTILQIENSIWTDRVFLEKMNKLLTEHLMPELENTKKLYNIRQTIAEIKVACAQPIQLEKINENLTKISQAQEILNIIQNATSNQILLSEQIRLTQELNYLQLDFNLYRGFC